MPQFFFLAVVALTSIVPQQLTVAAERPNIVLILADDLGANDLGCYGSTFHRTPRLDELAKNGLRFTQGYASCPVCSPTRASLNTGKVPARVGITDWLPGRPDMPSQRLNRPALKQQLALEETTLAELLKARGYATAHIGKWHLGGEGFSPQNQGYDLNIAGDHTGLPRSYFAPFQGKWRNEQVVFMPGLEEAPAGQYLTDRLGEEAAKFIAAHADKPFFLSLPHYGVHTPMRAPEEMVKTYDAKGRPVGSQQNPIYAAMLESVDRSVGLIIDTLAKHGLTDRTLVIFTSDNGGLSVIEGPNTPATTNAPLREGKGFLYEGGIRVPFIMSGYGVKNLGRTDDTPIWSCDVLPTVAKLCGVEALPADLDGVDLASRLQDTAQLAARALHWHYPHYANQGGKPGGAVRDGKWKFIEFYENGRRELYDLSADPRESRNLIAQHQEESLRLATELQVWRSEVDALMPTPNPEFVAHPQAADGVVTLPAKSADVFGSQLRYEPAAHKNTLGFWTNVDDFATWEFTIAKPGRFDVELLQGCGKGQGGSIVNVMIYDQAKTTFWSESLTIEDTGGFQNFVPRVVGQIELAAPGRYVLTVKPQTKAAAAVMDLRQVVLRPIVAKPAEK